MSPAELLLILLSWASHLSGYDMAPPPELRFVSHEWMVAHACYSVECNVVGWYNDQGIVYLVDDYESRLEEGLPSSILVHELVHYLQDKSGYWGKMTCEKRISREREAYYVQELYFINVLAIPVRIPMKPVMCP